MSDNHKPPVAIALSVPLAGTTSSARPLDGRRILALEQPAVFQGDVIHVEHSTDGTPFTPLLSLARSPSRLILLDLPEPTSGLVRVRLDEVQANVRTFFVTTR